MTRALLLTLALAAAASAQTPDDPAAVSSAVDLSPRYTKGDRQEVEARMELLLRIRLQAPSARIDRTSEQEQVIVRRYKDELTDIREGHVAEVERSFVEAWDGERQPGAASLSRALSPLHQRRIVVGVDEEGHRQVRARGEPPIPGDVLEEELHTERWESVLPADPVAVGARWTIEGDRLKRALGRGLGSNPEGRIVCRLEDVRDVTLDEGAPPQRVAVIACEVDASGRQGEEEDAPRFRATLSGQVLFSLALRKVVKVDLSGEARLRQTRRDGAAVVDLDGRGPLSIRKRAWFPERPRGTRPAAVQDPAAPDPTGLPPEPPRPGR